MSRADGTVSVATAGGNAFFRGNDVLLSVKLADEQFPPYAKVIPTAQTRRVVGVSRELLDRGAQAHQPGRQRQERRACASSPSRALLRITSENPDVGEGSEELDVDYAGERRSRSASTRATCSTCCGACTRTKSRSSSAASSIPA